ncbi:MAG: Flp pilus assembly protein CpaB [Pararhodobacter sp.]
MLRTLILVLSLGAGALAAFLTSSNGDAAGVVANASPPVERAPLTAVLVATTDLAQGSVVSASNLHWQPWPEEAVSAAFVQRDVRPDAATELEGRFVRGSFAAGEPIRLERLADVDARLLSSSLPAGRRAVALRVSAESTAGGFVLPNDRVDVLLTATEAADSANRAASRVIARNVRVLAIDQLAENTDAGAVIGSTATLELAERQVEMVLAAAASGMLSLALRSAADRDLEEIQPETLVPQRPQAPSVAPPAPVPPPVTIRVRRGTTLETVSLQ